MDYQQTAARIVQAVGGAENIANLSHCATRLRLRLADDSRYDKESVEAIPGVQGSVKVGSEYQIVIGNEVSRLYQAVTEAFSLSVSSFFGSIPGWKAPPSGCPSIV